MNRLYVIPIQVIQRGEYTVREPLYPQYLSQSSSRMVMEYGNEGSALVLLRDVTPEAHASLNAQADVIAFPVDLDQQIGAQLATVQNALIARHIPEQWVLATHTYRQVVRIIGQMSQFMQRLTTKQTAALFSGSVTLDTRYASLPQAWQDAILAAANELGYDTTDVASNPRLRAILKTFADQWHQLELFAQV